MLRPLALTFAIKISESPPLSAIDILCYNLFTTQAVTLFTAILCL